MVYSVSLDVLNQLIDFQALSQDVLLNALFGGVTGGIAGGLVFRTGGSFGGTSTLALILQRRTGTPMSTTFLYTDAAVIGLAGLVYGWEPALYAVVSLFVGGVAVDYMLEGPSVVRTAVIITDNPEDLSTAIMQRLDRGVTGWEATGMYTGRQRWMLYVSIGRSQVSDLRQLVMETDPAAFVVIGQGHTAYGEGFRRLKRPGD